MSRVHVLPSLLKFRKMRNNVRNIRTCQWPQNQAFLRLETTMIERVKPLAPEARRLAVEGGGLQASRCPHARNGEIASQARRGHGNQIIIEQIENAIAKMLTYQCHRRGTKREIKWGWAQPQARWPECSCRTTPPSPS